MTKLPTIKVQAEPFHEDTEDGTVPHVNVTIDGVTLTLRLDAARALHREVGRAVASQEGTIRTLARSMRKAGQRVSLRTLLSGQYAY